MSELSNIMENMENMQLKMSELSNIMENKILENRKTKIEFYLENSLKKEIDIESGKLRSENTFNESGIAIRTIRDGPNNQDNQDNRLGFSYSTNLNKKSIDYLIDQSIRSGTIVPKIYDFAQNSENIIVPKDIYDENIKYMYDENIFEKKVVSELELDETIQYLKKKDVSLDKMMLSVRSNNKSLLNSNNLNYSYQDSLVEIDLSLSSYNRFTNRMFIYRKLDFEKIKKDFKETIDTLLYSKKLPKRRIDKKEKLIFSPYAFSYIISCIFPGIINAETAYKKDSFLKINDKISSKDIRLVNDGLLDGGISSSPIDGEGFPSRKTTIIDKGIFVKPICDNYWSTISNFENTSNSVRLDFRSFPSLNVKNLIFDVECNKANIDEVLNEGIYITGLFLDPSRFNPKTGEYLFNVFESTYMKSGKMTEVLEPFLLFIDFKFLDNINLVSKDKQRQIDVICPYVSVHDANIVPMPGISKKDIIKMFLKKIFDKLY